MPSLAYSLHSLLSALYPQTPRNVKPNVPNILPPPDLTLEEKRTLSRQASNIRLPHNTGTRSRLLLSLFWFRNLLYPLGYAMPLPGLNSLWMDLQDNLGAFFFSFCYTLERAGSRGPAISKSFLWLGSSSERSIYVSMAWRHPWHGDIHGMATSIYGHKDMSLVAWSMGELTVVSLTGPNSRHSLSWKNRSLFILSTTKMPTTFNEIPRCTIQHAP